MKQPKVSESKRSQELWETLRSYGWVQRFDVIENLTRVTYWTNERGKSILVLEHAHSVEYVNRGDVVKSRYEWTGWDIYRRLCSENNIAKTYAALLDWTGRED